MSFCTSCGASLTPATAPPIVPIVPAPAATTTRTGPPGVTREPVLSIVLAIVTFGIYGLYYWWVTSREVDEYAGQPGRSHGLMRVGTIISLAAGVIMVFAVFSLIGAIVAVNADAQPTEEAVVAAVFGTIGIFLLAGAGALAGGIMRVIAKYRIWEMLEADERRRAVADPLSSSLMLALTVIGWFVSIFGVVLALIVLYMTQEHLNRTWAAATVRP